MEVEILLEEVRRVDSTADFRVFEKGAFPQFKSALCH